MAELDDVTLDGKPLHSLRVADLKSALEQRGLAKSGQKNALIKRLKGALMLENLQRTSTHHAGLQPNSQIGEEMSQNSFIKQYLAKQQELLRQRLEREAREATEADETPSPAGPEEDDHMLTSESTSCLPDKHHTVHSHLSLTQAEGGGGDRGGGNRGGGLPQDPGLMGSHRLDISPSHLPHEPPDTKAGRTRHPSNFPSHEEVATPSPPRAVASLSVRVVGQPERQGLPLMMPRSQEREETAPIETGPAQSVLQLSRSARAAAFVQADSDDEEEDNDSDDDDDEWGSSSNTKKNVRAPPVQPPPAAVPQRSRRKLQPPQHIPPQPVHQPPLQLRQPTPPPSPPPELSFPLPDTPKQSPHDQDEPVGDGAAPGPGTMPSPPPFKRQDSSSSSRSSSPEPPSTRRPGPLSLLVRKMESEGVFDGGQKVGIEGEMEIEEQEGSKPAEAPEVLMGTNIQTEPQNSLPTTPSVQHDAHGLESKKVSQEEKDEQKRGEEKENEKAESAAPFHVKSPKMFPLKRPQIFSAVPPPESLKSPSKPEQVSVLTTGPTCSGDDAMETEASAVMPESKHSEEGKEVKSVDKQSPRAEVENIMVTSSHSSSDEGEPGKTTDPHKPCSSPLSQSSSDSDSESSSSHSSSSPSHDKSWPHSQKKDKQTEKRKADIKEMKTQSPREIKQEALSEPAGQVAMEPEGRLDSESAMQQPDHQGADASDSRPEESSAAKLIAARKILLSGKTENASSESESVGGANRKRRWGSSTAVTAKRPCISITTESLKTLIPEIKPVLEAVVELHPDEGQLSGEDSTGPHDVGKLEEDEGLKIRRTVTQIVPSDGCENGEKKLEDDGVDDDDDDDEEEEKWTAGEKEKTRKRERSSDATMETQVADTIKVTPNDSLVRRSVSQQKSGVSVTIDDPIRPSRELSPPRGKTSNIIHVCNLVRPFTLGQLKELLNRTGTFLEEGFWIDKIKSHCFVTYSTTEEAVATREALHGVKWPTSNPKVLRVDFCEQDELDFHKGLLPSNRAGGGNDPQASGTSNRPAAPPPHTPTHREKKERERDKDGGVSAMRDLLAERERAMERRERTRSEREWDRDKVKDFGREDKDGTRRSRSRDQRRREREKSKEKRTEKKDKPEEPPAKLLDDLFRKTKAAPCIYWLPLTEEQAAQRALEREERKKEREKRRKELQDEEDKKREERRERAKGRDRDVGATGGGGGGGGGMGRSAEAERDRGKERERERGREGEKRRDAPRGNRNGDSKTAGGSRRSRSRSNTSRDRRR